MRVFHFTSQRFNRSLLSTALIIALSPLLATPSMAAEAVKVEAKESANANTPEQGQVLDGVIAVVNDNAILKSQLERATAQAVTQLRAKNQAIPPSDQLYSQVLEQMISRQIQLDLVKRQGINPPDNQVNNALTSVAKQNGANSLAELQQHLDGQKRGSYQALRQQVSEDLAIQALQQQQVARRVKISEQDIDMFLRSPESNALEQSQYRTLHIRVPYPTADKLSDKQKQIALRVAHQIAERLKTLDNTKADSELTKILSDAQSAYDKQLTDAPTIQGGDMGYHIAKELPTELSKDIMAMSVGQVSKPLATREGVNIIKLTDKRDDGQHVIEQWNTRHILISPSASLSPELAKQQIDMIYNELQKGADFATLASTYSKDGSASAGGSLGWVSEGEMVAPFEAMMKKTAVNDFSVPFQTQFGWHILKVDGKREQDATGTYKRNMAREALYQRLAPQALEDWLQELKAQSYIKIMN